MPRRRRRLTPGETALWEAVARSATPLGRRGRQRHLAQAEPPQPEAAPSEAPTPPAAPPRPALPPQPARPTPRAMWLHVDRAPEVLASEAAAPPRIDKRRFERLMRGKLTPEARLDLHGMTRESARSALIDFVLAAQARGLRLVLVITGKGRPDASDAVIRERHGVLRHSLPHWLASPPLTGRVLELRPAHRRHGGAGAVYLYLRRGGA